MIPEKDLRIDTFSNNNGIQHVRVTHLPTGKQASCGCVDLGYLAMRRQAISDLEAKVRETDE